VLGNAAPQLAGLAGIALVLAFGAIIPIEALCDVPGVGQLAWKAAPRQRDLPVLCALALVITLATGLVAAAGDLISGSRERRPAMTIRAKPPWIALGAVCLAALLAPWLAPYGYDQQFRDSPAIAAGGQFPWVRMTLAANRLSRLLYATRVSLGLAPAAACGVSIADRPRFPRSSPLRRNRFAREALSGITTISLSLPWIFLFVIMRAELPLNTDPMTSMILTFGLMGIAGWAWAGKVFTASLRALVDAEWMVQARASGLRPWRIAIVHLWPTRAQHRVGAVPRAGAGLHSGGSQPGAAGTGRGRTAAFLGQSSARSAASGNHSGQPLDTGAAWPADAGDDLSGGAGWIEA